MSTHPPACLGTLSGEFSFGHARQLESVLREHLCALAARAEVIRPIGNPVRKTRGCSVGAIAAWVAARGTTGTVLVGAVLVVASAGIYALSRRTPVTASNVNELPVPHPHESPAPPPVAVAARAAA